jgi:hypothetical protein
MEGIFSGGNGFLCSGLFLFVCLCFVFCILFISVPDPYMCDAQIMSAPRLELLMRFIVVSRPF